MAKVTIEKVLAAGPRLIVADGLPVYEAVTLVSRIFDKIVVFTDSHLPSTVRSRVGNERYYPAEQHFFDQDLRVLVEETEKNTRDLRNVMHTLVDENATDPIGLAKKIAALYVAPPLVVLDSAVACSDEAVSALVQDHAKLGISVMCLSRDPGFLQRPGTRVLCLHPDYHGANLPADCEVSLVCSDSANTGYSLYECAVRT